MRTWKEVLVSLCVAVPELKSCLLREALVQLRRISSDLWLALSFRYARWLHICRSHFTSCLL